VQKMTGARLPVRGESAPAGELPGRQHRGQATFLDSSPTAAQAAGMARSLRVEYPGALYHVMARGNARAEREADRGRATFLTTTRAAPERRMARSLHRVCREFRVMRSRLTTEAAPHAWLDRGAGRRRA
jgi:hypothetical protein